MSSLYFLATAEEERYYFLNLFALSDLCGHDIMLPTGGYVMASNVEALCKDGTLESEVDLL